MKQFSDSTKRADGRTASQLRPIEFVMNPQRDPVSSVLIKWGQTHVLCSVSAEEKCPPWLQGQGQGWITAEYGMLPGSTDKRISREKSRTNGRTQEIQRLIGRSLRSSVDLKLLGERTLQIDCDVIQADGGTRVASIVGASVALFKACEKLKLSYRPRLVSAVSLGWVKGALLTDLAYTEDSQADVDSNIVMLDNEDFVEIQATAEKKSFSRDQWNSMLEAAQLACREVLLQQRRALDLRS
jgi:ribonuclease PH